MESTSENAGENLVDVGELAIQRKGLFELFGAQAGLDFRVGGDGGAEIAVLLPARSRPWAPSRVPGCRWTLPR
jgi:hypothetical protein